MIALSIFCDINSAFNFLYIAKYYAAVSVITLLVLFTYCHMIYLNRHDGDDDDDDKDGGENNRQRMFDRGFFVKHTLVTDPVSLSLSVSLVTRKLKHTLVTDPVSLSVSQSRHS